MSQLQEHITNRIVKKRLTQSINPPTPAQIIKQHVHIYETKPSATLLNLHSQNLNKIKGEPQAVLYYPERAKKLQPKLCYQEQLPDNSQATVFIKQHYEELFHLGDIQSINTDIEQIKIQFGIINFQASQFIQNIIISIHPNFVQIRRTNEEAQRFETVRLLPSKFLEGFGPKQFLQKKIWIKISRSQNVIEVRQGDLCKQSKVIATLKLRLDKQPKNNWFNCEDVYPINSTFKSPPLFLESQLLSTVRITLFQDQLKGKDDGLLNKCIQFLILQKQKILQGILDTNPSFLKQNQTVQGIEKPLQVLYGYLKNFTMSNLPDFDKNSSQNFDKEAYLKWPNLSHAIHQSLIRNYSYHNIQSNGKEPQIKVPMGLLNHLSKFKNGKNIKGKTFFKPYQGFSKFESKPLDQLNEIYQNRCFYIRMELNEPVGEAPGSDAVLQIWPPFCCSAVHNHGQAYGLIKVLNNQITVENYQDLNFLKQIETPYQVSTYLQNQYAWLSQLSFGIHRLVNLTHQTTLNLQAYQSKRGSQQFFQFIETKSQHKSYAQYYPQNDWQNYLQLPELIEKNEAIRKFYMEDGDIKEQDTDFIKKVIQFYGMRDKNGKLDHSFPKFVMTMQKEYEIHTNQLVETIKRLNLINGSI